MSSATRRSRESADGRCRGPTSPATSRETGQQSHRRRSARPPLPEAAAGARGCPLRSGDLASSTRRKRRIVCFIDAPEATNRPQTLVREPHPLEWRQARRPCEQRTIDLRDQPNHLGIAERFVDGGLQTLVHALKPSKAPDSPRTRHAPTAAHEKARHGAGLVRSSRSRDQNRYCTSRRSWRSVSSVFTRPSSSRWASS